MDASSTQIYLEILEKTNQQLGLWSNPYGVMVATLGVLFAILAIVATYIVYRQSSNYKEILDKFISEQKKYFHEEMDNTSRKLLEDFVHKTDEAAKEAKGNIKDELESVIAVVKQGMTPLGSRRQLLTEAQLQSILSLLASFGADQTRIDSAEGVMRGRTPLLPGRTAIRTHLTKAQIQAILSLIASFGADDSMVRNMDSVLSGPYVA